MGLGVGTSNQQHPSRDGSGIELDSTLDSGFWLPPMFMGLVLPEPNLPAQQFEIQRGSAKKILSSPGLSNATVISGFFSLSPRPSPN